MSESEQNDPLNVTVEALEASGKMDGLRQGNMDPEELGRMADETESAAEIGELAERVQKSLGEQPGLDIQELRKQAEVATEPDKVAEMASKTLEKFNAELETRKLR